MWIEAFFWAYIAFMIILGSKRYIPSLHALLNDHPIGEWGMYSVPVKITRFKVVVSSGKKEKDITTLASQYLWHNFVRGQFVSISHPDLPRKAFYAFPRFLAKQGVIKKSASTLGRGCTVRVLFDYYRGDHLLQYTAEARVST